MVVTTVSGYRLRTPVLEYSKRTAEGAEVQGDKEIGGVIHTTEEVDFEADKIRIQGVGMTYQIGSRFLQIHSDVRARLFPHTESDSHANSTVAAQNKQ